MVSYAANAEDVVLHRALCGNDTARRYVDVGACSPQIGSVTRHFYEAGWSGIDVEPLSEEAAELREARPRDVVVEAALGLRAGEANMHVVGDDRGLSSLDEGLADGYVRTGHPVHDVLVQVRTLADVLDEHCDGEISFLKIDVEGAEREVIMGNDWSRWRPRVVLVEATNPWSHAQSHARWEDELLEAGYLFASFDGVNRFYARNEEPDLVELLAPASVLDDFVSENVDRVEGYVHHLQAELDDQLAHVAELESYIGRLDGEIASRDRRILELEARITELTTARGRSRWSR
jgi:FkbM family methyltransferase